MTTLKMTARELEAVRKTSRATQSMYDRANAEFKKRYPKIAPEDGCEECRFGGIEITLVGVVRKPAWPWGHGSRDVFVCSVIP